MQKNNRYNQYSQPYLPPQSGDSGVYQPVYDPSETDRWVNLLDKRQQRYDVGRQQFSNFTGTASALDTYDPNALQNRIGEFSDSVKEMVDRDYNGDFGLAANDISDMIAEEKGQAFYKANAFQQEQVKAMQQAQNRKRGLGERLIVQNDPRNIKLQDAIDSEDYQSALQYSGIEAPNFDKLAGTLLNQIKPDSLAGLTDLDYDERSLLTKAIGNGNLEGFLANEKNAGTRDKFLENKDGIIESLANSFLEQAGEPLIAELMQDNREMSIEEATIAAKDEATGYIKNKMPQFMYESEGRNVTNVGEKSGGAQLNTNPLNVSSTTNKQPMVDNSTVKSNNRLMDKVNDGKLDLNTELDFDKAFDTPLKKKAYMTAKIIGAGNEDFSKRAESFSEMVPALSNLYKKHGLEKPSFIMTSGTMGSVEIGTEAIAALANLPSVISGGIGDVFNNYAKVLSGEATREDALNLIKGYEESYGKINIPKLENGKENNNSKMGIAINALNNEASYQKSYGDLPAGDSKDVKDATRYNKAQSTTYLADNATQFSSMEAGVLNNSYNKNDFAKSIDLSVDELNSAKVSQYDPSTGLLAASAWSESSGERITFLVGDNELRNNLGFIRDINKDLKDKGYSIKQNPVTGRQSLTVKVLDPYSKNSLVEKTIELNEKSGILQNQNIEYYQKIMLDNYDSESAYFLDDYSVNTFNLFNKVR